MAHRAIDIYTALMWSLSRRKRITALAGVVCVGTLFATQGGSNAGIAPWPGLADSPQGFSAWLGTAQSGITESTKAKQWARVPLAIVASAFRFTAVSSVGPEGKPGVANTIFLQSSLVSPAGSKHEYGTAPAMVVRTVAFGSIPVTATIQVSQRRDAAGLPVPLVTTTENFVYAAPDRHTVWYPVILDDSFDVVVTDLVVDGVDLKLPSSGCGTTTPAPFNVASEGFTVPDGGNDQDPQYFDIKKSFIGQYGGTLTGTIDVPSFGACHTADGDDVGPVLSASVSGENNPLSVRLGASGCGTNRGGVAIPPAPGEDTPSKANCEESSVPYLPTVPEEFPYPSR